MDATDNCMLLILTEQTNSVRVFNAMPLCCYFFIEKLGNFRGHRFNVTEIQRLYQSKSPEKNSVNGTGNVWSIRWDLESAQCFAMRSAQHNLHMLQEPAIWNPAVRWKRKILLELKPVKISGKTLLDLKRVKILRLKIS